jgi:hypothetical protein
LELTATLEQGPKFNPIGSLKMSGTGSYPSGGAWIDTG